MVHGQKEFTLNQITRASDNFLLTKVKPQTVSYFYNKWFFLLHASTLSWQLATRAPVVFTLFTARTLDTPLRVVKKNSFFNPTSTLNNLILHHLKSFTPIFSFFIQNLSKFQRKHTRGKKEKLRIMWKYLPPYKRFFQTMKWLFKDLKFYKHQKLEVRLLQVFQTAFYSPTQSFLVKLKDFVHTFVFKKYRYTLLETLQTTP